MSANRRARTSSGLSRFPALRRMRERRASALEVEAVASNLRDLVIITGLSGAGRSEAMACFEDAGYFCVDNLPPAMIGSLIDLFAHEGSRVENAAIVSDARGGSYFDEMTEVVGELRRRGMNFRILFLDADDQTIMNRFKETRRRHPLTPDGSIADGIQLERELTLPVRALAEEVIDTTDLSPARLRRLIADDFLAPGVRGKLTLSFLTFGFKHGPPRNVDLSFDVRFLPNPHYVDELREQTGLDKPVSDFVNESPGIDEFYRRLIPLLDYLLPAYAEEGKSHLTIGIGCTGGRHRSVSVAEKLAAIYRDGGDYTVEVMHRDIGRQPR
ncbi:MAG: RNase adapter RapZ, partial [Thermoleophilaceae bacterium]|nr:RNase adapter RapZ [Thermoleophilaceae bacterium]